MCGVWSSLARHSTLRSGAGARPRSLLAVGIDARDGHEGAAGAQGSRGDAAYPGGVPEPEPVLSAPDQQRRVRWGLGDAAAGWLVGLVCGGLTSNLVLVLSGVDDFDALPLGWVAVAQLGLWVGLLGAPYLAARFKGNGMVRDFGVSAKWVDVVRGGVAGLVGQFAILWLVYLPMSLLSDVSQEDLAEPAKDFTDKATGPLGVVLLVLIVGVGAPIVEEIFYRGLVQRSLVRRVGVFWGIAITSVVFGAVHFQPLQFPALVLAGALFGVLAHRAGRLGPAIAAHVVFNMTAVISLLVTT